MIELIGSALAIIAGLGGTIGVLVKYNWNLSQKAEEAKHNHTSYVLSDLKQTISDLKTELALIRNEIKKTHEDLNKVGKKLSDTNERVISLIAYTEVQDKRITEVETNYGKIIMKGVK
jgi:septal ring factor EnvC (AmiA/AmiB activator)